MRQTTPLALAVALFALSAAGQGKVPGDACKLLTDSEVRKVFAQAAGATRETRAEKYGIAGCTWKHPAGTLGINLMDEFGKVDAEALSLVQGFVDPLRPQSARHVRMIAVSGVGDAAMGFAEPRSEAKGIPSPIALLIVQRGGKQFTLFSNQTLTEADRDAAMKALQELARAAVGRI